MALLTAVAWVAPASAAERLALEQDQVVYGEEGSTVELAELAIEPAMIGALCTLQAHAENQFSVHPGNDLLITTGGAQTVIEDVEAEPDAGRDLSAGIVLGPVLLVELRFGPDQVSSMGFDLSVDCATTAPVVIGSEPCPDPSDQGSSSTTTPSTDCQEPTPVAEVPIPQPTLPEPCSTGVDGSDAKTGGDGSLTVGPDGCPEPTTTAAPPPSTAPPTTTPPATTVPATAPPTVKGLQIFRLPQTPAAAPVQGAPDYTG